MQLLNSKFFKPIGLTVLTAILVGLASLYQSKVLKVEASVQVIVVSHTAIPFGTVFPGEDLAETYTVALDTSTVGASYTTFLAPINGLEDLCPFLEIRNIDNPLESDSLARGILQRPTDTLDKWQVRFKVPAIKGEVSQDHEGKIIVKGGEFGCKIIISAKPELLKPKISLKKQGVVDQQDKITYTLSYEVLGQGTLTNAVLTDMLPFNTTFVSASNGGTYNAGAVTWYLGALTAPSVKSVQVVVNASNRFNTRICSTLVENKARLMGGNQQIVFAGHSLIIDHCRKQLNVRR